MSNKSYVGGATAKNGNFGAYTDISFNRSDLEEMMNALNEKGWVNLRMQERKEPSRFGQTHSIYINDWKPDPNYQQQPSPHAVQQYAQGQHPQYQAPVNTPPVHTENIIDLNDPEDFPF